MKTVFISQPMRGKSNEQIKEERKELIEHLHNEGYNVIDSIVAKNAEDAMNRPIYYLGFSILRLSACDVAWFMDGWEDARGCKIEHTIVEEYGIPIMRD